MGIFSAILDKLRHHGSASSPPQQQQQAPGASTPLSPQAQASLAAQAAEPGSDNRGTADYKRNVVRVYCERGLRTAISAARAGEE